MTKLWHRLFLDERPSISLSLFRPVVAFTTWSVVFPSLVHLEELYFRGSFRVLNGNFFPVWFLELVQKSPDALVAVFAALFHISAFALLIGLFSQASCLLMTLCCYYFYALNSYHVSTLTWDILMVTLFLMCVTGYHGDYFSVDCLFRKQEQPWERKRPYFIQRLLQMQLAFTFFYTVLSKTAGEGNWLTDNPLFYVLNYPPDGVTKTFLLRDFLREMPQFVYWSGILIVTVEYVIIIFLFWRKTRLSAIHLGIFFQTLLLLTLDVPATFFFLFPAMYLLFIDPNNILEWINERRALHRSAARPLLIYDGHCGFCRWCLRLLKITDLFDVLEYKSFYEYLDEKKPLPAGLWIDEVQKRMYLVLNSGKKFAGYEVFRRICWSMPMMFPLIPLIYFPGMGVIGPRLYDFVAKRRRCLGRGACSKGNGPEGPGPTGQNQEA